MSKPLGIRFGMNGGVPSLSVTQSDKVSDAIWDAVQLAIACGWDARKFKLEASQAWEEELSNQSKDAVTELMR